MLPLDRYRRVLLRLADRVLQGGGFPPGERRGDRRRTAPSPWFLGADRRRPDDPPPTRAEAWDHLRRALPWAAGFRAPMLGIALLAVTLSALGVAEPLLLKELVDGLAAGDVRRAIVVGLVGLFVAEGLRAVLSGWMNVVSWRVRLGIDYRVREQVISKLHALPVSWHQQASVGATILKVNQSIPAFSIAVADALGALQGLSYLPLALVAMLRLEWRLTLLVVLVAPLPVLVGLWAAREQTARERALTERWHRLFGRFAEVMSGIVTVKASGQEDRERARFLEGVRLGNAVVERGVRTDSVTGGLRAVAGAAARLAALGVGAALVLRGEITLGTLMAFVGYAGGLLGPIQQLTTLLQVARRATVPLGVVFDILDAPEVVADRPGAEPLGDARGELAFERVAFAYGGPRPVLEDVSFRAAPGETVAIVGPSGSGKTTLFALAQRLLGPTAGRVTLDGRDLAGVTIASLRERMAVVPQEPFLFNDTVLANVAYARPGAARAEVEEAARLANALEFVRALPEGWDTVVGERGGRLSGGQRQRLAIARALLQRPVVLLLDEPTSALDARSEELVTEALARLQAGRTTLVIAHRLRTVAGATRIVVLREGRVEAVGTHHELLAASAYYAALVEREFAAPPLQRAG